MRSQYTCTTYDVKSLFLTLILRNRHSNTIICYFSRIKLVPVSNFTETWALSVVTRKTNPTPAITEYILARTLWHGPKDLKLCDGLWFHGYTIIYKSTYPLPWRCIYINVDIPFILFNHYVYNLTNFFLYSWCSCKQWFWGF